MKRNAIPVILFILLTGVFRLSAQDLPSKAYANYDFIPGETILFEDDFNSSADGEFPPRWNLLSGQGVVNRVEGLATFIFTEGDKGTIAKIGPAMKTDAYLGDSFTVEFDFLIPGEDEVFELIFTDNTGDNSRFLSVDHLGLLSTAYFPAELQGAYQGGPDEFMGKWHHGAIAYKNQQIKCFIDQYRQLVIPRCGFTPVSLCLGGCAKTGIRNVKIAAGGGMNMLGKILTDGKFITHAITFDVGKSAVRGESMGFLNELARWLKENPAVKLEIGGHTDSDGDDASNLKLSQARAESVRAVLVSCGVEASRLTPKGYGESKPIDNNSTSEGKANNRRVEFTKI